MKRSLLMLSLVFAPMAGAQSVQVQVRVPVPTVRFDVAPTLVEVEPGLRVVPEYGEEVFYYDNVYWTRRSGRWWRAGNYRGGWVEIGPRYVPGHLSRIPDGRYRRWNNKEERKEEHRERKEIRHEDRDDRRDERSERFERREDRQDDRHEDHDEGRGHGKDKGKDKDHGRKGR